MVEARGLEGRYRHPMKSGCEAGCLQEAEMLKAVLTPEEADGLPDGLKEHYRQMDDGSGRSILDVGSVEGFELQNVSGLKSSLAKERGSAANAQKALKALKDKWGDLDVDAAREALAKVAEFGDLSGDEALAKKLETAREGLEQKFRDDTDKLKRGHEKALAELRDAVERRTAQLGEEMIGAQAAQAIAQLKGRPGLLLPIVRQRTKVVEGEDGRLHVRVIDGAGNEMLSTRSGSSDPMTIAEYVTSLRGEEDYAPAFDGTPASGAGARRSGQGRAPGAPIQLRKGDLAAIGANLPALATGKAQIAD